MTKRTNLLFVFADQLGRNHMGYGGDNKAITPNLDRLASQGVDFVNCVSGTPVCAAFRASLMTGMNTTSTGMVINELRMRTDRRCFGHVLTDSGCQTCYIGKWHMYANEFGNHLDIKNSHVPRGPHRLGFDGYWAAYGFHHAYYWAFYSEEEPVKISYGEGVYEPDGQTDMMIDWLTQWAEQDEDDAPFAAFLSYGTPHDPWDDGNVPPEYLARFQDVPFPNPPNYSDEDDPYADNWGRFQPGMRERLEQNRRVHHAMTANLDWNVGRLLEALDQLGLAEDTIVVFTADHGSMFGAHGRRNKNVFYEEACVVPFLVRAPGQARPGSTSDVCLATIDIMPTLLSMLGLTAPGTAEGMDLSPFVRGEPGPEPGAALLQNTGACAIWEDGHEWRALRDKRYTYAVYRVDGAEFLFDNREDPWQLRNAAGLPAYQGILERMRAMLKERMEAIQDTFEASSYYQENWISEDRIILRGARG